MFRERVFVIGAGPSLEGFDFSLLKNEHTIVVNSAAKHVPQPTYFLTADSGIIRRAAEQDFWGMGEETTKVVVMGPEHPNYNFAKGVLHKYDQRIQPFLTNTGNMGYTWDKFVTGKNTGFCAVQFAVLLGYANIYLLGFDMSKDEQGRKYFYSKSVHGDSPYDIFLQHFIVGINKVKKVGRPNLFLSSKPSRLEPYLPFVPVEEVLS